MPTNITDVSAFTSPITKPVDGDPDNDTMFVHVQSLANRSRFTKDRIDGLVGVDNAGEFLYCDASNTPTSRGKGLLITPYQGLMIDNAGVPGGWAFSPSGGGIKSNANSAQWCVGLSDLLPNGSILVGVKALVQPGVPRVTTGNRITLDVVTQTMVFEPPGSEAVGSATNVAIGAPQVYDDGGTGIQSIVVLAGVSGTVVDKTNGVQIYVDLHAGNDAGTNFDKFWGLFVGYYDAGPRND